MRHIGHQTSCDIIVAGSQFTYWVILEHAPCAISASNLETVIHGPPFDNGKGRRLLARQIQVVRSAHRNETSASRSRLPLILLPWGLQQSQHYLSPRMMKHIMSGCQRLIAKDSDSSRRQSPFCT